MDSTTGRPSCRDRGLAATTISMGWSPCKPEHALRVGALRAPDGARAARSVGEGAESSRGRSRKHRRSAFTSLSTRGSGSVARPRDECPGISTVMARKAAFR
jgi:hypothetical protein